MANEIYLKEFLSTEELFISCIESILTAIQKSISLTNQCNVLLSGGSTPEPLYKLLAEKKELVSQVKWGLVDERFIDSSGEFSNEKMIRNALGSTAKLEGMVYDSSDYSANLIEINERYVSFIKRTDIAILGMGSDGHFASLFPGDESSEKILNSNEKAIFNTRAPSFPEQRITCSLQMLLDCQAMYLIITGPTKKGILLNTELNLPIHKLLARRNDIKIYYAD
ncbi:MAG: 6-phosphogluconolactonase [Bacteroidota bacterium]